MKTLLAVTPLLLLPALSSAQQPPGDAPRSMADAFMQQLDANKDGRVSESEFLEPHKRQFKNMDSNRDGGIDQAEIKAFEQQMRQRMEQRRQQQGRP